MSTEMWSHYCEMSFEKQFNCFIFDYLLKCIWKHVTCAFTQRHVFLISLSIVKMLEYPIDMIENIWMGTSAK